MKARNLLASPHWVRVGPDAQFLGALALIGLLLGCTGGSNRVHAASPPRATNREAATDNAHLVALQSEMRALQVQVATVQHENTLLRQKVSALEARPATRAEGVPVVLPTTAGPLAATPPTATAVAPTIAQLSSDASAQVTVYVTRTGSKYHAASCRYASAGMPATLAEAATRLQPCKVCSPPLRKAATTTAPTATSTHAPAVPRATTAPVTGGQCAATTQKGTRCKRKAASGSSYCWQHP